MLPKMTIIMYFLFIYFIFSYYLKWFHFLLFLKFLCGLYRIFIFQMQYIIVCHREKRYLWVLIYNNPARILRGTHILRKTPLLRLCIISMYRLFFNREKAVQGTYKINIDAKKIKKKENKN